MTSGKSWHYREPRDTPILQRVYECCLRRPGDERPAPTTLDIIRYCSERGEVTTRPSSDVAELRAWFAANPGAHGHPSHYVADAVYAGRTEGGKVLHRFGIYTWGDPRAVEARRIAMEKDENKPAAKAA